MIAVLQRVYGATLYADGEFKSKIEKGLHILLGVIEGDVEEDADLLAEKISKLRIFSDENGKMNLSVNDVSGEVMVVSNFTLAANYSHGNRPDYFSSAAPEEAKRLYDYFTAKMSEKVRKVKTGVFGADMRTEISSDGPVTIIMHSDILKKRGGKTK